MTTTGRPPEQTYQRSRHSDPEDTWLADLADPEDHARPDSGSWPAGGPAPAWPASRSGTTWAGQLPQSAESAAESGGAADPWVAGQQYPAPWAADNERWGARAPGFGTRNTERAVPPAAAAGDAGAGSSRRPGPPPAGAASSSRRADPGHPASDGRRADRGRRSERGRAPDGGPWSGTGQRARTGQEPGTDQQPGTDQKRGSDQPLDGDRPRKKGKERRAEREAAARGDLPDLPAGADDPDYDWIRSLGDGRSPGRGRGPVATTEPGRAGGATTAQAEAAGPGSAYRPVVAAPAPLADLPGFSPDTGTQPGLASFAADPGTDPGPQYFVPELAEHREVSAFAPEPSAWPAGPQLAPEPGTQLLPAADFGPAPAEFPLPQGPPGRHYPPHPGSFYSGEVPGLAGVSEPTVLAGPAGAFGPPDTFWSPSPRESQMAQESGVFGPDGTVASEEPRKGRRSRRSRETQSAAGAAAAPRLTPPSGSEQPATGTFARSDTTVIDGIPAVGRDRMGQPGRVAEQEPGAGSRRGGKRTKGKAETPAQGRQRRRRGTGATPEKAQKDTGSAAANPSAGPAAAANPLAGLPAAANPSVGPAAARTADTAARTAGGSSDPIRSGSLGLAPDAGEQRQAARTESRASQAARAEQSRAAKSRRAGRRRRYRIVALAAVLVVLAGAVAAYAKFGLRAPKTVAHVVSAPRVLGAYTSNSGLAAQMHAGELRHGIVARAGGEARNVVAAVYETAARTKPDIILFIGGNLSGSSASAFISSFTGLPRAFTTAAGSLGGQAACVPGSASRPAECAWADADTFGVVTSPTLSATGLAGQLRLMRPRIERVVR